MSIFKLLKQREITDKKGKKKYSGKIKFKPNLTIPGFSGNKKTLEGTIPQVNIKAKIRDLKKADKQQKEIERLQRELEKGARK